MRGRIAASLVLGCVSACGWLFDTDVLVSERNGAHPVSSFDASSADASSAPDRVSSDGPTSPNVGVDAGPCEPATDVDPLVCSSVPDGTTICEPAQLGYKPSGDLILCSGGQPRCVRHCPDKACVELSDGVPHQCDPCVTKAAGEFCGSEFGWPEGARVLIGCGSSNRWSATAYCKSGCIPNGNNACCARDGGTTCP